MGPCVWRDKGGEGGKGEKGGKGGKSEKVGKSRKGEGEVGENEKDRDSGNGWEREEIWGGHQLQAVQV